MIRVVTAELDEIDFPEATYYVLNSGSGTLGIYLEEDDERSLARFNKHAWSYVRYVND